MSQLELHKIMIGQSVGRRHIINISDLSHETEIDPELVGSLVDLLFTSFKTDDIVVDLPSRIYLLAEEKKVVASVFLTTTKDSLPLKYQVALNGYYIYNVCTAISHRGRGLMKNLLSQILQEDPDFPDPIAIEKSICYPSPVFYLTTNPENVAAQNLYCRLGFKKIDQTGGIKQNDIFEWTRRESQ